MNVTPSRCHRVLLSKGVLLQPIHRDYPYICWARRRYTPEENPFHRPSANVLPIKRITKSPFFWMDAAASEQLRLSRCWKKVAICSPLLGFLGFGIVFLIVLFNKVWLLWFIKCSRKAKNSFVSCDLERLSNWMFCRAVSFTLCCGTLQLQRKDRRGCVEGIKPACPSFIFSSTFRAALAA